MKRQNSSLPTVPSCAYTGAITKGTAKIKPPAASEELRLRHRRIGLAWEMASQRHSGRTWLQGATAEAYRKLSGYVLGPAVSEIGSSTEKGAAFNPPWSLVLHYEYQVRKLAYKLVLKESIGIGEALKKAMADAECRQRHFMDRLTLEQKVVPSFPFGHSTTDKRKHEGKGGKTKQQRTGQEKQARKNRATGFWDTNNQGVEVCRQAQCGKCESPCPTGRAHVCARCLANNHVLKDCPGFKDGDPEDIWPPRKGKGGKKGKKK